jgi:hypothetical protein
MGEELDEVESAGQGGTRVSSDEVEVRIRESALPRTEEERASAVCHLRAGQRVCQSQETVAGGVGSVRLRIAKRDQNGGTKQVPESESRAGSSIS